MLNENRDVKPRAFRPLAFLADFFRRLNGNRYSLKKLPAIDGGNNLDDGTSPAPVPTRPYPPVLVGSYAQPLPKDYEQDGNI